MKFNRSLSRRTVGLVVVIAFILAGAAVGFLSQSSILLSSHAVGGPSGLYAPVPFAPSQPSVAVMFSATQTTTIGSASFGGRLVELQGYVTLEVADAKAVSGQATSLTYSLGGYVASSSYDRSGSGANLVLRIPQQNFTLALRELGLLGQVTSQSVSSNDVTEEYVNLQAQLNAYETETATLLRILNASKTVTDALSTEEHIQQVQANINRIQGQIQVMQRLVTFATINLHLTTPPAGPELDLGDVVRAAVSSFYLVLKGVIILGATLAPIAVLGGVVYYPYKHFAKRRQRPLEGNLTGTP